MFRSAICICNVSGNLDRAIIYFFLGPAQLVVQFSLQPVGKLSGSDPAF